MSQQQHFEQLAVWIEMESAAEAQRMAERRERQSGARAEKSGETLLDLVVVDHQAGLGGRYLFTFVKRNRDLVLPWNRLRVGSPVLVGDPADEEGNVYSGVVSARTRQQIQVALDEWPEGERFRIDLSPDEITRKRQQAALAAVVQATGRTRQLRNVLVGDSEPRFAAEAEYEFRTPLNPSQQVAIQFAMSAQDVAIIHGPPGTGKTTTVTELIHQAVLRGDKVLACAPSNTAVDNLVEKLAFSQADVVRLGHPARVASGLRELSLDMQVQRHDNQRIVREMMREAEQLFRQASRYTRSKPKRGQRQELRREARELKDNARLLERQAVQHILDRADVICATTSLDNDLIGKREFDLVVIDEACQCVEPAAWIPILRADRIVLAGDHCQLPPTIVSTEAAQEGFAVSLLERLVRHYGQAIQRRLTVQYRMHEQIMNFSSSQFYDRELVADATVQSHLLEDLPHVTHGPITASPMMYIDTAGAGWEEELEPDGESKRNPREAELVRKKVGELIDAGLQGRDIAVIAPYAAQVRLLREQCDFADIEIDTVDGFQGREKEAVVITMVRSNTIGEIGFLGDQRRMNVALTRARRKLIVIGDSATLGGHAFYASLLEYFEHIGAYHTVWEEVD